MINIKNLNLFFEKKELLKNINFHLKQNQNIAIIGESGSGKSLFARAFIRLFDKRYILKADEFNFENQAVLRLKNLQDYRKKVALIMQETHLALPLNLDIGQLFHIVLKTHTKLNEKERKKKAYEVLDMLNFADKDLLWHSFSHTLSTGMIRRVNLALALVCSPKVLILDEITSSLDKENALKIKQILENLKDKLSLIIITHDLNLTKMCDEIYTFSKGEITQKSSLDEFFKSDFDLVRVYKEIYA